MEDALAAHTLTDRYALLQKAIEVYKAGGKDTEFQRRVRAIVAVGAL